MNDKSRGSKFAGIFAAGVTWPRVGIITGFVLGLLVTIMRERIVPIHYTYDSQKIQAIAQGITDPFGDYTFENVALVYRYLGLSNSGDFVAVAGYVLASAVLMLAIWKSGRLIGGPITFLIIVASFCLSAVYLGNYSKDVIVLAIVALVLLAPRKAWGDILVLAVICAYGTLFRQYWLIVAASYLVFRLLTLKRIQSRYLLPLGSLGAALVGLAFFLALGLDPDHFRAVVNDTRTVEAQSQMVPFWDMSQPLGGSLNLITSYFALVLPLPLLATAGLRYAPVVMVFALIWLPLIGRTWSMKRDEEPKGARQVVLRRAVSLLFAFLLTQALFEPDYGSALRHLTPLLSLVVFVCLAVPARSETRSNEAAAGEAVLPVGNLLAIHWGKNGGGPWVAVRMAEALGTTWPAKVFTSFNQQAEILSMENAKVKNDFPVTTYRSATGLILGVPRMLYLGWKLRQFVKRNDIDVVYSAMLSIWQSMCTYVFLPRNVRFVASIHDATEHPGDAHWLLRLCRKLDCSRADVIVAYSDAVQSALRSQKGLGDTPTIVIPLGTDQPVDSPRKLADRDGLPIRLGFAGRIVEYKGLDLFVDVVRELHSSGLDFRGFVAGSGDVDATMVAASTDIIDWHVEWIPEVEMKNVFQDMDILILPYREASQSGIYSLALSAGVPSVATPMAGLIEQIGESGGGIVSKDVSAKALADAVRSLAVSETYDRISQQCLDSARAVSWEQSAKTLTTELISIVASREAARRPTAAVGENA